MEAYSPETMEVKVINKSKFDLPKYATPLSAGVDLRANIDAPMVIRPFQRVLVPTGLYLELPDGVEAQVRPRSGLSFKHGISVANSPGTIDPDYRGEIKVILVNLSQEVFLLNSGERIAQMVFARFEQCEWLETEQLSDTQRGAGGFGHTGTK